MHTGAWNKSLSLAGKTVAVIGSGSSSVQLVPTVQPGATRWVLSTKTFLTFVLQNCEAAQLCAISSMAYAGCLCEVRGV